MLEDYVDVEVSEDEANIFMEEFEKLIEDIDAVGIFTHNTTLSLPMFLPGFGVAWGLFSAWSTGYAFANISAITVGLSETPALSILYYSPYGFMEIVAYSLGISRGFILIVGIIKKTNLKSLLKPTGIEIAIVIGLLLAGGFLEHFMIESERNPDISEENEPVTYSSELPKACEGVTSVETQLHPTAEECVKLLNEQIFVYCLSENNEDESIAQACRAKALMQMDQNCKENEQSPYNTCMMTELKQAYQNMVPNQ